MIPAVAKLAAHGSEAQLQRAVVDLLRIHERQGRLLYFAVPNAAKRSFKLAKEMKRQGLRPGIPDLIVVLRDGPCLFWELKSGKGKLSPAQEIVRDWLVLGGHRWAEIRSVDDAVTELRPWVWERRDVPKMPKLRGT